MQQYIESLAELVPGPVILYNIPKTTHHSIPLEIIEKASYHPNLWGLKDSERDLGRLNESISLWKDRSDFSFLIGWAAQSLYGLSRGADGIVPSTGNIRPDLYVELFNAVLENDMITAEQLQNATNDLSQIYQKDMELGESIAALKIIMNKLGLCREGVLPPLTLLSSGERQRIDGQIEKSEWLEKPSA